MSRPSDAARAYRGKHPSDRLVLRCLADYANNSTGHAFPSIAELQEASSYSERGVRNALDHLEADGAILRSPRPRDGHAHETTMYTVVFTPREGALSAPREGALQGALSAPGTLRNSIAPPTKATDSNGSAVDTPQLTPIRALDHGDQRFAAETIARALQALGLT